MLKNRVIWMALAAAGLIAPVMPNTASAMPTFARQTGYTCEVCHTQYIPKLSGQGRAFKLSGMTDISPDRAQITGDGVELPVVANVGVLVKFRFQQKKAAEQKKDTGTAPAYTGSTGAHYGEVQVPDEGALWFGGKVAANWGAALEWGSGGLASFKLMNSHDMGDGNRAGVSIYTTDALGPFWGMELYNTGVVRNHRQFENRGSTLITQATGVGADEATGIMGFYGAADGLYASLALWAPAGARVVESKTFIPGNTALRVNYAMEMGEGSLMVGLYNLGGATKTLNHDVAITTPAAPGSLVVTDTVTEISVASAATGFDVQYDGGALEVIFNYLSGAGAKDPTDGKTVNLYDRGGKLSGYNIGVAYTVMPHLNVKAAMMSVTDTPDGGTAITGSATTFGVNYGIAQNVELVFEQASFSGDVYAASDLTGATDSGQKSEQIIMLEMAF